MLDKISFFSLVVETESISIASKELGISPSTGSRWLVDLEKQLGVKLYRRSNRLIAPTEAGKLLHSKFTKINESLHQITSEVSNYQYEKQGLVRIVCTPVLAHNYVIPILYKLLQANPSIRFGVKISSWGFDYIKQSDIVITAQMHYVGFQDKNFPLIKRELLRSKLVCVATKEYIEKHGTPTNLAELKAHRCLVASSLTGRAEWGFYHSVDITDKAPIFVAVSPVLEMSDSDALISACLSSIGIAYLPEVFISKHLKSKKLIPLLTNYGVTDWVAYLYSHPLSERTAAINEVYHTIIDEMRETTFL